MVSSIHSARRRVSQLIWIIILSTLSLILLFISFMVNVAQASSQIQTLQGGNNSVTLQGTPTPTPTLQFESTSTFSFSLETLGYTETTLDSPFGNAEFSFKLPENWLVQTDGLLELDLSYAYDQVDTTNFPTQFGNLTVKLDGQTLEVFSIEEKELNHYQLRIPLPSDLLATSESPQHLIRLQFDAEALCAILHDATLVIHSNSFISLNYSQRPLTLDLSRYPQPFYQQNFLPDQVRFVLNSSLTSSELADTLAIAAKLGDLTNTRLVISSTTDITLTQILSSPSTTFDENFIVIGQPQNNRLIPLLNEVTQLPVSLHQRQMELVSQWPATIAPGDTFTYTFTLTNTSSQAADLSLLGLLPPQTQLVNCTPKCLEKIDDNTIQWDLSQLAPNRSQNLYLTLKGSDVLTGVVEQTVTMTEARLGPVNADTFTSTVVVGSTQKQLKITNAGQDGYFFMYDSQAVAKDDGIIQEIASPWGENRAILMITGLSDEAVRKASQAMSSEARFPGMIGPVALVRDTLAQAELNETISPKEEFTLADLGYSDRLIDGALVPVIDYFFVVPNGWQLNDAAKIDLYFNHSQLIDYTQSGLSVLLNRQPIASVPLNDDTADKGHIQIPLDDADVRTGEINRLSVQVPMSLSGQCIQPNSNMLWFTLEDHSKIFLAHQEVGNLSLDLDDFPKPFQADATLSNLLFALPSAPTVAEIEMALRLAVSLGSTARGKAIVPTAILGNDLPPEALANYDIITIGRPSRQPLIQKANAQLPQPFQLHSDVIEQRLDNIIFRLPDHLDLGYLQLIPSPWGKDRAFLAVTGTSDTGVEFAIRTLIANPGNLFGNLALVTQNKLTAIDTRELTTAGVAASVATAVPGITPVSIITATTKVTPTVVATPDSTLASSIAENIDTERNTSSLRRPAWLLPVVGLNGLVVIGIFAFVYWRTQRGRT